MHEQDLKRLLENVHAALENAQDLDEDTRALLRELDDDIHRLAAPDEPSDRDAYEAATDKAKELQARFQAEHPVAERFFREIIDVLAKVGI